MGAVRRKRDEMKAMCFGKLHGVDRLVAHMPVQQEDVKALQCASSDGDEMLQPPHQQISAFVDTTLQTLATVEKPVSSQF